MKKIAVITILITALFCFERSKAEQIFYMDDSTQTEYNRLQKSRFEVEVRFGENKKWDKIKVYGALVSNITKRSLNNADSVGTMRDLMAFAPIEGMFKKKVKVRIRRLGEAFKKVAIRPSNYEIAFKRIDSQSIELSLKSPKQRISIEYDNDRQHNLFLIPNIPYQQKQLPQSKPYYFEEGEHHIGRLQLKDRDTIYIGKDAIVYGQLEAKGASNITIMGHGILCGSKNTHDFKKRHSMIYFEHCENITIDGIVMRGSPSWNIHITCCNNVKINDIKQISWMKNSDGIDLCNCKNVVISNCFLRNYDDNISIKNFSLRNRGFTADGLNSLPLQIFPRNIDGNTDNIRMSDCTIWADCAHNLLVGPESKSEFHMQNITFENIQILEGRETIHPWRGALAVMVSDEGKFKNIKFKNITLDNPTSPHVFSLDFCKYRSVGKELNHVTLENIIATCNSGFPKSIIHGIDANHKVTDVLLKNIQINQQKVNKKNYTDYIDINEHVENIEIE